MLERWKQVRLRSLLGDAFFHSLFSISHIMMFELKSNNLDEILDGNSIINDYLN